MLHIGIAEMQHLSYSSLFLTLSLSLFASVCVQTVPKTLSPQWREQFDLHLFEETGGVLEITVWDRDTGRRDDFIGRSVWARSGPVRSGPACFIIGLEFAATLHPR